MKQSNRSEIGKIDWHILALRETQCHKPTLWDFFLNSTQKSGNFGDGLWHWVYHTIYFLFHQLSNAYYHILVTIATYHPWVSCPESLHPQHGHGPTIATSLSTSEISVLYTRLLIWKFFLSIRTLSPTSVFFCQLCHQAHHCTNFWLNPGF